MTELTVNDGITNYVTRWPSASNRVYDVLWATNLQSGFSAIASSLSATPPENSYTDTLHAAEQVGFYRIEVALP